MTYFPDLSPCTYFESDPIMPATRFQAIGWLDADHPFPQGPMDPGLLAQLADLVTYTWEPILACGPHQCELCPPVPASARRSIDVEIGGHRTTVHHGSTEVQIGDRRYQVGISNVFIPGTDTIYLAPSMVLHYIVAHRYLPPAAFLAAVRSCPPIRTRNGRRWNRRYRALIQAKGPPEFGDRELWRPVLPPGPWGYPPPEGFRETVVALWRRLFGA